MSRFYTPEEMVAKRKRSKYFLYAAIVIGTIVMSSALTLLSNGL